MKSKISPERLNKLNIGEIETQNLIDGLSIDFTILFRSTFPKLTKQIIPKELGVKARMQKAAELILEYEGSKAIELLALHKSDTVRGWGCFLIALTITDTRKALQAIKPLANDPHFGVREWAWIAIRPLIAQDIEQAITILKPWIFEQQNNIRRFAVEITRPRGVWCSHIEKLKKEPWLGIDMLEPLKSEPIKYVQDSVANWLNDAAKSNPDWVMELCKKWQKSNPSKETLRICKRAQRSIK